MAVVRYAVLLNTTQGQVELTVPTTGGVPAAERRAVFSLAALRTYGDLDEITPIQTTILSEDEV